MLASISPGSARLDPGAGQQLRALVGARRRPSATSS
jgi:hypothetical protein